MKWQSDCRKPFKPVFHLVTRPWSCDMVSASDSFIRVKWPWTPLTEATASSRGPLRRAMGHAASLSDITQGNTSPIPYPGLLKNAWVHHWSHISHQIWGWGGLCPSLWAMSRLLWITTHTSKGVQKMSSLAPFPLVWKWVGGRGGDGGIRLHVWILHDG